MKSHLLNLVVITCALLVSVCWAIEEPNDIFGVCSASSGITEADSNSICPSWFTVIDRNSTDTYTHLSLIVDLDACQIVAYDVNSIPQGTSTPVSIDVQKDDLFVVWDEDYGHGSNQYFTFTNNLGVEDPDGYIADPNCTYARVYTEPENNIINWVLYRVLKNGMLTITSTGENEHDVIHLYRNQLEFDKVDDVNDLDCRSPEQEITYTICWENTGQYPFEDAYIVDWLPDGVSYPGSDWGVIFDPNIILIPPDPGYHPGTHTYVWDLGTIEVNDANCVSLTVVVEDSADPGMLLHNMAELISGGSVVARAFEDTRVCCWGDPNVIYVDQTATDGFNSGTSWKNAYTDLTDALIRVWDSICTGPFTIYVAAGTYAPDISSIDGFVLLDGVSVYGGFPVGGGMLNQRDPKKHKTILTGLIDEDAFPDVDTVVTMGDETLLDGFTVIHAFEQAVYGNGVDFSVVNCIISKSARYGIQSVNGDVEIQWCTIRLNDRDGIRHSGTGFTLSLDNSWILRNGECGIYSDGATPTLKNCIISESDLTTQGRAGIRLYRPSYQPILYNNTIANNKAEGVFFSDDGDINGDPNNKDWPDIQNCIVYYNNGGDRQFSSGLDADRVAAFCVIQDCNEINNNHNDFPGFAYKIDPNNIPDPNNYHLAYNAFCIDKGNDLDLDYTGQVDIDGEGVNRQYGSAVDIGADEVYSCDEPLTEDDVFNELDWNADGLLNFKEFSAFSRAWLSHDPNEPGLTDPNDWYGWNSACNLVTSGSSEYVIDLADLTEFIDNGYWLWTACWKANEILEGTMMMSGSEGMLVLSEAEGMMGLETFAIEADCAEPVEEDPYAAMSNTKLASMIRGIYAVLDAADTALAENDENVENWLEIKDFLESVLEDIKASRQ